MNGKRLKIAATRREHVMYAQTEQPIDWCCAGEAAVAAHLAAVAPGMPDEEIGWLPRPVQAQARAVRDAASVPGMSDLPASLRVAVYLCPVCKSGGPGPVGGTDGIALCAEHNVARLED